ncbi:thioredoxin family protein [Virgibacillus indicus]|uniref:Thioredoxin family protein n=1 Tax=Virgibacillus indicus TaxID=2024554 RepID=A0A265N940_9BACI|nr:thioredoxin family protein [Virgibacillus indicus]OZU88550.1 thioredoxin family protein [Virgibacillus indicus]
MTLNQWFEKGMQVDTYIESMEKNKEGLLHVYDNFPLPEDEAFHQELKNKNLRAIVLTEDWCGDAMVNMPILLRLSEASDIEVRVLLRDQNLELMDQYLTNGKSRSIPIFIFIDESGNEVAKWGPRAQKVQQFVDEASNALPDKEAADYKEKFSEMIMFMNKSFRENTDFWDEIYKSLKQTLQHA